MTIYCYDSTLPGAPELSGTPGALRSVLKACLVDGFGASAVSSLSVSGGVATATYSAPPSAKAGTIVALAGATPAALNGEKRIASVAGNTVTFPAPGVADGTASGSITSKVAPATWQELFPGALANVIALKPSAAEATGCVLRVDDSGANWGVVDGYESMSGISDGMGRFPLLSMTQDKQQMVWAKSTDATSTSRPWCIVADERFMLLYVEPRSTVFGAYGSSVVCFGDIVPYRSGDPYAACISGSEYRFIYDAGAGDVGVSNSSGGGMYLPRGYLGLRGAVVGWRASAYLSGRSGTAAYQGIGLPFPNGADNSLRLAPVEVIVGPAGFRGRLPGVYHSPQQLGRSFRAGTVIDGQGAYLGRRLLALNTGGVDYTHESGAGQVGTMFVDLTGPWRL
ncbi:hypothetical protein [Paracidovorax wautersii]|uniref:Uncharacterized protein n=1 Tax=Paracidovorax wautersii TaxID=1177982 RepID=A0A1I2GCS7_9BURK|nr:hypothetical protein [Paracidovorax wautersii]SFF14737.1 hypothetical protein SAMN04489711_11457 [Paracidovorax wautersii]